MVSVMISIEMSEMSVGVLAMDSAEVVAVFEANTITGGQEAMVADAAKWARLHAHTTEAACDPSFYPEFMSAVPALIHILRLRWHP